ncbi:MAG: NADH-ubiquinone oxidoreductase-F iron-sulfur binding region domain-containing protein [Ilumatobacteraceae bacterium]
MATSIANRVMPSTPIRSLAEYEALGGGAGLRAARAVAVEVVLGELEASGLRGRGGAGFPTATKWRTILSYASDVLRTSVVVNAAEGEPGTFKDRSILRSNPYAVLEGALIAAAVVDSRSITVATKDRFTVETARLRDAIAEMRRAGWCDGIQIDITAGPSEYLYGEETALLEVLDGRPPFPRIAPPWRRGVIEVVRTEADLHSGSGLAADVEKAGRTGASIAPPTLVNNVETLANVPAIIANGAAWFRSCGTAESPGTVVCTVTGSVGRPLVIEVELGTPLRSVLDLARGGDDDVDMAPIVGVLMGVSNVILTAADLDTPVSYEAMSALGTGLGSASFIVVDDTTDPVALAAGVSRFLAVESCGQCTACKQDGLAIFEGLRSLATGGGTARDLALIEQRLGTITDGARCNLARQHQVVVGSILGAFDDGVRVHIHPGATPCTPVLITELVDLDEGAVTLDEDFLTKRADWTHARGVGVPTTSSPIDDPGSSPVDRLTDHRAGNAADR